MFTFLNLLVILACVCVVSFGKPAAKDGKFNTAILKEDISSQVVCKEFEREPTYNCAWAAGLNYFADLVIDHGKIMAYKILWKTGRWSNWYIPGVNDIDKGYNPEEQECDILPYKKNSMRRKWAFFYNHKHIYIICKPGVKIHED